MSAKLKFEIYRDSLFSAIHSIGGNQLYLNIINTSERVNHQNKYVGYKVFVGGLPINKQVTEVELCQAFEQIGKVVNAMVINTHSKQCKGFGFVVFEKEESCNLALTNSKDIYIHGQKVFVDTPNPEKSTKQPGYSSNPSQDESLIKDDLDQDTKQVKAKKQNNLPRTARNEIDSPSESITEQIEPFSIDTRKSQSDHYKQGPTSAQAYYPPIGQDYIRKYNYGPSMIILKLQEVEENWSYFNSHYKNDPHFAHRMGHSKEGYQTTSKDQQYNYGRRPNPLENQEIRQPQAQNQEQPFIANRQKDPFNNLYQMKQDTLKNNKYPYNYENNPQSTNDATQTYNEITAYNAEIRNHDFKRLN